MRRFVLFTVLGLTSLSGCGGTSDDSHSDSGDGGASSSDGSSASGGNGSSSGGSSTGGNGSSSGGSSTGGNGSSSGGSTSASPCDEAADRMVSKYTECGGELPDLDDEDEPSACTETTAARARCVADCYDATSCAVVLGDTDDPDFLKEATEYAECALACNPERDPSDP